MVSVCVATYNGARFVEHQVRSILSELEPQDEIVLVDDASSDSTVEIVRALGDPRIRIFAETVNRGYVRTFEKALERAGGDVIMLSDQDDEWVEGRRSVLIRALEEGAVCASGVVVLGTDRPMPAPLTGRPWVLHADEGDQRVRNTLRILGGVAPYYGCAMAIRRGALGAVLPFPPYLRESHDLWIGAVGISLGSFVVEPTPTVRRRLHETNASSARPRGLRRALESRILVARMLLLARRRARAYDERLTDVG